MADHQDDEEPRILINDLRTAGLSWMHAQWARGSFTRLSAPVALVSNQD